MSIAAMHRTVAQVAVDAGVPAVTDPGVLLAAVAQHPVVVFVDAPTLTPRAQSGSVACEFPVHVVMRPPAGQTDLHPLLEVLPALIHAYSPADPLTPETLQLGDQQLPGYLLTVRTRTTC